MRFCYLLVDIHTVVYDRLLWKNLNKNKKIRKSLGTTAIYAEYVVSIQIRMKFL